MSSWRLGSSLGIDPVSCKEKFCTFDCIYCQLGETKVFRDKREVFVPTEKLIEEVKSLPPLKIDYITFSGRGEPTLSENLGEMIRQIKKIRKERIAVLTNSSLIGKRDVQRDLSLADFVMTKLDVCSEESFQKINRPMPGITFDKIIKGIKEFRSEHKGRLSLQIMFIEKNKIYAPEIARIAKDIDPDEVQINTPLRPCQEGPLSRQEIDIIKRYFEGMNIISVYEAENKQVESLSKGDTLKRRG